MRRSTRGEPDPVHVAITDNLVLPTHPVYQLALLHQELMVIGEIAEMLNLAIVEKHLYRGVSQRGVSCRRVSMSIRIFK